MELFTEVAEIVKVEDVLPAGIETDAGTVAESELDLRETVAPLGAGPLSVTVPVEVPPPASVLGLRVRPVRTGAVTVRFAEAEKPFASAVTVEVVSEDTAEV